MHNGAGGSLYDVNNFKNGFLAAVEVKNHHLRPGGIYVSTDIVRWRLHELIFKLLRSAKVMVSDKSRFCLYKHDARRRVYKRPGERYN